MCLFARKIVSMLYLLEKNGSGKTRVLNAIATFLNSITKGEDPSTAGIWLNFNTYFTEIRKQFEAGNFVVAYYKADRIFTSVQPKHVEKVQLKVGYAIDEMP